MTTAEFHDTPEDLPFPGEERPPAPRPEDAAEQPLDIRRSRKKPVEVQTVKASTDNLSAIVAWIKGQGHHAVLGDGQLTIQTLEGPFTVRPGDIVVRGIQGEFYRCDYEIYRESYDDLGAVE